MERTILIKPWKQEHHGGKWGSKSLSKAAHMDESGDSDVVRIIKSYMYSLKSSKFLARLSFLKVFKKGDDIIRCVFK